MLISKYSQIVYLEAQSVLGLRSWFDQDSPSHPYNLVLLQAQVSLIEHPSKYL